MEVKEPTMSYMPAHSAVNRVYQNGSLKFQDKAQQKRIEDEIAEARAWAQKHLTDEDISDLSAVNFTVGHTPEEFNWNPPTTLLGWEAQAEEWEREEESDDWLTHDEFKNRYSKLTTP